MLRRFAVKATARETDDEVVVLSSFFRRTDMGMTTVTHVSFSPWVVRKFPIHYQLHTTAVGRTFW